MAIPSLEATGLPNPVKKKMNEAEAAVEAEGKEVPSCALSAWHRRSRQKYQAVIFIELDDGKIYRKALYLMVKTMVSCRFSLKPIQ